mmetsp:Transcript_19780/g.19888  ORF Transcript_19780/g.19888 Transcript_19780/m.19888 type:complete len:182 (+) Transcript_19780:156-701(+)|eukprot:CAMPEP_0182429906 /NCGR_PEP_ID=MMETSP1167-20130531/34939_1 /TAXON_ID=2988 /ORGANISM="Mallomonas Sp, Strain CCMP3275" /LENGTH=181 /DNA_ID=CAMNT_0024614293 /DNA_START=142 /DNA_END=687 /DNA_ORIENTATION=-
MAERLAKAQGHKDEGNTFFKDKKYSRAKSCYGKALAYIKAMPGSKRNTVPDMAKMLASRTDEGGALTEEMDEEAKQLEIVLHQNIALCYLKMNEPQETLKHCDLALQSDSKALKALLRKGQALLSLKRHEKAREVLEFALSEHKNDLSAVAAINTVLSLIAKEEKEETLLEKQRFRGIFSK